MSSTSLIADDTLPDAPTHRSVAELLVCLPAIPADALPAALDVIAAAFPGESVLVASPGHSPDHSPDHSPGQPATPATNSTAFPSLQLIPYTTPRTDIEWVLAAGDYAAAAQLALDRNARAVILLGDDTAPLSAPLLRSLADSIRTTNIDLALPRFDLGPNDGLVNSALLYPLSRGLFGADIRFPLPIDAAFSARMAQRLLSTTQRLVALNQSSSLLWPVTEAAIAGFSVRQVLAPTPPPTPPHEDFNALFITVAGSLFADIDAKASFWQRARGLPARPPSPPTPSAIDPIDASAEIHSMVESFHLAQDNLQEIWSLVLPPQSRLALKKLSQLSPEAFIMEPDLWARVVYDFTLAFHLRTLNRSHLLGAMTPLYLAWVASYLRTVSGDPTRAANAIELTASAFESEKSYIVSRWRWPDRFNP
jgi:glucosylglycerate synthase